MSMHARSRFAFWIPALALSVGCEGGIASMGGDQASGGASLGSGGTAESGGHSSGSGAGGGSSSTGGAALTGGAPVSVGGFHSGAGGYPAGGAVAFGGFQPGQGGQPTGGATGQGASISDFRILSGGYIVAGAWHGYALTRAVTSGAAVSGQTTTITPADFSAVAAGATELCVAGSVGASTDYGGMGRLVVNVNQAQLGTDGGDPPVGTIAIGGTGITVKYTNPGGSELRIQIQTPTGEGDPTGRWCAVLTGVGGTETLTWDQFWGGVSDPTVGCWNSGGDLPLIGTLISQVALVVPGGNSNPVPFNFCLQGLGQAG